MSTNSRIRQLDWKRRNGATKESRQSASDEYAAAVKNQRRQTGGG